MNIIPGQQEIVLQQIFEGFVEEDSVVGERQEWSNWQACEWWEQRQRESEDGQGFGALSIVLSLFVVGIVVGFEIVGHEGMTESLHRLRKVKNKIVINY